MERSSSTMDEEECFKVAVVGGGLAGLSAAEVLSSSTIFRKEDVVVLEASSSLGGRILSVSGLAPWPVEIGPEFLHGTQNSSIKKLVDEMGCVQRELNFPDYYYIGHEGRLLTSEQASEHADIEMVHDLFKALIDEDSTPEDMSMAEYLRKKGVSSTVMSFAEAIYGNDFGCSLDKLGVHECIQEAHQWIYGDTYIILDRPLSSVVNHVARNLNIRLDWAVKQVEHLEGGNFRLRSQDGRTLRADFVILAVPVTTLQQSLITFHPPLPEGKLRAAKAIGMSNVMKVVMAFTHQFWPKGLFDVVCSDCFLPEVWMTEYPEAPSAADSNGDEGCKNPGPLGQYIVVGFIAGDGASRAAQLSEEEIFLQSLTQLDRMFGKSDHSFALGSSVWRQPAKAEAFNATSTVSGRVFLKDDVLDPSALTYLAESPETRPASHCFRGGMIVNWADRHFIRGGYSHPSVNARGARLELAKPVGNIFFAGEATHPGVNPCLQAAIDTGRRAAHEVWGTCRRSSL
ncbi:protein MpOMT24 [Marchantia polymorpha subsp. ruderalis]